MSLSASIRPSSCRAGRAGCRTDAPWSSWASPPPDGACSTAQDFRPGEDTRSFRRLLVGDDGLSEVESFGISLDGKRITVSRIEESRSLKLAEGVPGLE